VPQVVLVELISSSILNPCGKSGKCEFQSVKSVLRCALMQRSETDRNTPFSNYGSEGFRFKLLMGAAQYQRLTEIVFNAFPSNRLFNFDQLQFDSVQVLASGLPS
jgi:hypothetical protein